MDELVGLPLASFRRRALAIGIDFLVLLIIKSPFAVIAWHAHRHGLKAEAPETIASLLKEGAEKVSELAESALYFAVAMKITNGQTIGKWVMKIRVVSLTQDRMGSVAVHRRALGYGASLLEGGFGFFQYYLNRNRQTVHDRIAETIVLYEGHPGLIDPPLPSDATPSHTPHESCLEGAGLQPSR